MFVAVPLFGIKEQGLGGYLKSYVEPTFIMLPFNIISELSRTLALAVRLFGNMMSGAMIIGILLTITPFIFPIVMTTLGLLTGMVQAYIFSILAAVYIAAATRTRKPKPALNDLNADTHTKGHTMDSMTIIAVASIVIAGITIGFGSHGARAGGREGGRDGAELAGAAARCVRDHHPDPVRGPGDDRVDGDLLLRGLDDPHLRQSVLEPRHRAGRGEVAMLIDWFTVGAQALNFVILVWLMRRFLYKPILHAIDAREKKIAAELADAAAKKAEARRSATSSSTRTRSSTSSAPRS